MPGFGPLVSTEWLADHLGDAQLRIIDGSARMPGEAPARPEYEKRHIKGAVFFDIDEIADKSSGLPHMLPPPELFERKAGALGISNDDIVVVYDDKGCFSSARVWWTFRVMGHENVAVLDGGLPKWLAEGRPVTDSAARNVPASYKASFDPEYVCSAADVRARLDDRGSLILDARSYARFCGEAPEPREGFRSGAMPGAANLPFTELFNGNGVFLSPSDIAARLMKAGVSPDKEVVTTCGSGVTAAVLSLALELTGHPRHRLYDGSWAEWGDVRNDDREYPVVAGV